jgi:hypothetical protein
MATAKQNTAPHPAQALPASRFNALKHGIYAEQQVMFDETAGDLADLDAEVRDQYKPATPTERALVDTLIHNEWRLRRMRRVEAELWQHGVNAHLTEHPEEQACNSADAFVATAGPFERLQRIVNACERNYHRALKEILRLQAKAPEVAKVGQTLPSATPPQPAETKPSSPNLASLRKEPDPPAPTPPPATQKEPSAVPEMDDETFRLRKAAIFADSMAKYGRK